MRHTFSFAGGEKLTTIGAVWFVSYLYHLRINNSHKNWENVSTVDVRISNFESSIDFHKSWLEKVLNMSDSNLNKNTIGLSASQVKQMAKELLKTF